jgi:hypothetical protein
LGSVKNVKLLEYGLILQVVFILMTMNLGGFHHPGCDVERCPKCGGQLISCGCLTSEEELDDLENMPMDELRKLAFGG